MSDTRQPLLGGDAKEQQTPVKPANKDATAASAEAVAATPVKNKDAEAAAAPAAPATPVTDEKIVSTATPARATLKEKPEEPATVKFPRTGPVAQNMSNSASSTEAVVGSSSAAVVDTTTAAEEHTDEVPGSEYRAVPTEPHAAGGGGLGASSGAPVSPPANGHAQSVAIVSPSPKPAEAVEVPTGEGNELGGPAIFAREEPALSTGQKIWNGFTYSVAVVTQTANYYRGALSATMLMNYAQTPSADEYNQNTTTQLAQWGRGILAVTIATATMYFARMAHIRATQNTGKLKNDQTAKGFAKVYGHWAAPVAGFTVGVGIAALFAFYSPAAALIGIGATVAQAATVQTAALVGATVLSYLGMNALLQNLKRRGRGVDTFPRVEQQDYITGYQYAAQAAMHYIAAVAYSSMVRELFLLGAVTAAWVANPYFAFLAFALTLGLNVATEHFSTHKNSVEAIVPDPERVKLPVERGAFKPTNTAIATHALLNTGTWLLTAGLACATSFVLTATNTADSNTGATNGATEQENAANWFTMMSTFTVAFAAAAAVKFGLQRRSEDWVRLAGNRNAFVAAPAGNVAAAAAAVAPASSAASEPLLAPLPAAEAAGTVAAAGGDLAPIALGPVNGASTTATSSPAPGMGMSRSAT